jgi:hypothetical protein
MPSKKCKEITIKTSDVQLRSFLDAWKFLVSEGLIMEAIEWEIGKIPRQTAERFIEKCDIALYGANAND